MDPSLPEPYFRYRIMTHAKFNRNLCLRLSCGQSLANLSHIRLIDNSIRMKTTDQVSTVRSTVGSVFLVSAWVNMSPIHTSKTTIPTRMARNGSGK